jgi:CO dehydrogenase nickel-insertion accessory protein CooC1
MGAGLGIRRAKIVANKVRDEKDEILIRASFHRDDLLGVVRMSDDVHETALGMKHTTKPALTRDLSALFDNLLAMRK